MNWVVLGLVWNVYWWLIRYVVMVLMMKLMVLDRLICRFVILYSMM